MKLKRIIIILVFFISILPTKEVKAHPFYISLCQINYNQEDDLLEFAFKIFTEDLDKSFKDKGMEPLFLGESIENLKSDSLIVDYLNSKVSVKLNDNIAQFYFIGKEFEDDAVWCYLEIKNVESIESLAISNQILLDTFSDQTNIVQFTIQRKTTNFLFNKNKTFDYIYKSE